MTTPAEVAEGAAKDEARALCATLDTHERETLVLLCKGLTIRATAKAMGELPPSTAAAAERIRRRLGVNKMIEAAVIATKAGLV